jgi:hypothetical protein
VDLPFGTDRFHRAFYDEPSRQIRWEPFHEIDWEAKARAYLKGFHIDRPTAAELSRLKDTSGALDFVAPLEPRVTQMSYILLSGEAVTPLRPTQLNGVVVLGFDAGFTQLLEKHFSGEVGGNPARAMSDAAFVIAARAADVTEVHRDANFKVRKPPDRPREIICTLEENGRTISWTGRLGFPTEVERTLSFRLPEGRFLLVQWKPDPSNCAYQYVLFSVGGELTPIAWNLYGCDV